VALQGFGRSLVRGLNGGVLALMKSGVLGGSFVEISYVGRRSGKKFSTPVN
jgi:hypothetical protein